MTDDVPWVHDVSDSEPMDDAAFEQMRRAHNVVVGRAAEPCPTLVGLTEVEARQRVEAEGGLWIRFAEVGQPVLADFGFGRITAYLRDGTVVRAGPG